MGEVHDGTPSWTSARTSATAGSRSPRPRRRSRGGTTGQPHRHAGARRLHGRGRAGAAGARRRGRRLRRRRGRGAAVGDGLAPGRPLPRAAHRVHQQDGPRRGRLRRRGPLDRASASARDAGPDPVARRAAETLRGDRRSRRDAHLHLRRRTLGSDVVEGPVPERLADEARRAPGQDSIERLAELHDAAGRAVPGRGADLPAEGSARGAARGDGRAQGRARPVRRRPAQHRDAAAAGRRRATYLPSPADVPPVDGHRPRDGAPLERRARRRRPSPPSSSRSSPSPPADLFFLRVYSGRLEAGERACNPRTGRARAVAARPAHARRPRRAGRRRSRPATSSRSRAAPVADRRHAVRRGDARSARADPVSRRPSSPWPSSRTPAPTATASPSPLRGCSARTRPCAPRSTPRRGQLLLVRHGRTPPRRHARAARPGLRDLASTRGSRASPTARPSARRRDGEAEYQRQVGGENLFARVAIGSSRSSDPGRRRGRGDALAPGSVPAAMVAGLLDSIAQRRRGRRAVRLSGHRGPRCGSRRRSSTSGPARDRVNSARATPSATRSAARRAVVLEPYGRLEVRVPEEFLGAVMKTLQQRRAIVEDTGSREARCVVRGVAPIGEMFGYLTALRSHTQGRGSFSLEPLDYRPLPDNLVGAPRTSG